MDTRTETRMYVGQTGTHAFDGFAGYRVGQVYEMRYTVLGDGRVIVEPDHVEGNKAPIEFEEKNFNTWFVKG
jgi:hypothetical protein